MNITITVEDKLQKFLKSSRVMKRNITAQKTKLNLPEKRQIIDLIKKALLNKRSTSLQTTKDFKIPWPKLSSEVHHSCHQLKTREKSTTKIDMVVK